MRPSLLNTELNKPILDAILTNTQDLLTIINQDGIIEFAAPSIDQLLGVTQEECVANTLFQFLQPKDLPSFRQKLQLALIKMKTLSGEYQFLHQDGTLLTFSMQIIPIESSHHPSLLLCMGVNITNQIQQIDNLQHSLHQYQLIGEHTTDLIRIMGKNHMTLYASPSYQTVLGYNPAELIGLNGLNLLHPEDSRFIHAKYREMKQNKLPVHAQFRYRHKDGHWILLEGSLIPIFSETGGLEEVILVSRDITLQKQAEEAMANSEKLSVIGQLAAGVAHEIRNPLTSLKGFIQLLKSEATKNNHYFEIMLTELDRINFIVSELLVLAKPRSADFAHKNLHEIITHVMMLLNTQAILNNVQLVAELDPRVTTVFCVENHLKQVFMNLIKNSIEAIPSGGKILIKTEITEQNQYLISFTDDGRGIPPELIPKLGEPFFTTKEKGSGLGLMVSHKIIKDHHGDFKLSSEVDKGTRVEVILPFHPTMEEWS